MRNDPEVPESTFGLDRNRTVGKKLFRTLVLLLLAGFFGIFTALVVSLVTEPWAKFVAKSVLEICWVFWFLAMVFVWWTPRWLRSHYLHAEHRMLRLATVLKFAAAILFVVAVGLVTYLIQIGVLPLEPK
jgi:hypothetical protein